MRETLELKARKIEMVLASHKIQARVEGGVVTPRYITFRVKPILGVRVERIKALAEEIALFLGESSCRIYRKDGFLSIEIPRRRPTPITLSSLCLKLKEVPPFSPILGVDEEGLPILVSLPSPDVTHILVAGTTGSGKTELLRTMISSLAMYNPPKDLSIALLDPKGRGFGVFEGLPHLLAPIATEPSEAIRLLKAVVEEMERRDREGVKACGAKLKVGEYYAPRLVVFVDELAEMRVLGGKEVDELITRLAQRGRESGIHLVVATQKPTLEVLGTLARANFPVRIVGKVTTPEEAKVASGIGGSGADKLLGRGDFILVGCGEVLRFQGAIVRPEEIKEIITRLRRR